MRKLLVILLFGLSACGPKTILPSKASVGLHILCEPPDSIIFVDDKLVGSVERFRKNSFDLPEGFHRIELRHDGYFSSYAEVTLVKGEPQKLEVKLRQEPF